VGELQSLNRGSLPPGGIFPFQKPQLPPDKEAKMTTGFNWKSREKKAVQDSVDEAICLCQSLQEELADEIPFLLDMEKARNGYNVKSQMARVVNIIVKFVKDDFDHIRQKTKSVNDDLIRILGSMQESLKKTDVNDYTPELSGKYAKLEEIGSRLVSVRRSLNYRLHFAKIILRLFRPLAENESRRTTLPDDRTIGRAYEFLLDLFLPPDRAEETSTALQDVCRSRWEKRYGPRKVAFLCFVHIVSAICSHHTVRLRKLGSLVLGIAGLKKAFSKFWGA
jgi:hypothetical protein